MEGDIASNVDEVGLVGAYTAIIVANEKCNLTLILVILSDTASNTQPTFSQEARAIGLSLSSMSNIVLYSSSISSMFFSFIVLKTE